MDKGLPDTRAVAISSITDTLLPGQKIESGGANDSLYSSKFRLQLTMQDDGNLVLKRNDEVCWATDTNGAHPTPCSLVMQQNGELAVFDAEHTKLWAVQVGDDIVNGSWVISDPVPGSWFCLKEGYGALYHPEGYALWALLDGTAVEGPRWHNQVRVLNNEAWCRMWDIGPMELPLHPYVPFVPEAAMQAVSLEPQALKEGTTAGAASDAPAGAPAPTADPDAPKLADLKGFVSKPKLSGPCFAALLGPEDAVAVTNFTDILLPGQNIESGGYPDSLYSDEGRLQLIMQGDGNLVLKRNDEVCWASNTYGIHPTPCSLVMQENGELAVFDKNYKKLWRMEMYESTSDSTNRVRDPVPGSWFCLKEGYGAVYHPDGQPLWALLDTSAVEEWQRTALLIDDSGVVVLEREDELHPWDITPMQRPLRLYPRLGQPADAQTVIRALDAVATTADAVSDRVDRFLSMCSSAQNLVSSITALAEDLPPAEQTDATIALLNSLQGRFAEWQANYDAAGGFQPIEDTVRAVKDQLSVTDFKHKLEQLSDQLEIDIPKLPAAERQPAMDKVIVEVKLQMRQFDVKAEELAVQMKQASFKCSGIWNQTNLLRADLREVFKNIATAIEQYTTVIIPGLKQQLEKTQQEIAATLERIQSAQRRIDDRNDKRNWASPLTVMGGWFSSSRIPGIEDLGDEMQKPGNNLSDNIRQLQEERRTLNESLQKEKDRQQEDIQHADAAEKALKVATELQPTIEQVANMSVALLTRVGRLQYDLTQATALQAALFAQAANDGRDGLLNLVADVVKAIRDRKRAG